MTREKASEREKYYIRYYDAINNGYNIATGGFDGATNRKEVEQYSLDGEYIQSFESALCAANYFGSNTNAHILEVCDGVRRIAFGYLWCYPGEQPVALNKEEIEDYMTHSKLIQHAIDDQSKAVCQYSMDGQYLRTYCSISEASRQLGINTAAIISVCQQNSISAGGFRWSYEQHPYEFRNRDNYRSAQIICVETGTVYDSITDASQALHIDRHYISLNCKGKYSDAGGKHFQFVGGTIKKRKAVSVYSADDQFLKRFDTMKEAAAWCGISESTISKAMKHQGELIKKSYRFREVADNLNNKSITEEEINEQQQLAV